MLAFDWKGHTTFFYGSEAANPSLSRSTLTSSTSNTASVRQAPADNVKESHRAATDHTTGVHQASTDYTGDTTAAAMKANSMQCRESKDVITGDGKRISKCQKATFDYDAELEGEHVGSARSSSGKMAWADISDSD